MPTFTLPPIVRRFALPIVVVAATAACAPAPSAEAGGDEVSAELGTEYRDLADPPNGVTAYVADAAYVYYTTFTSPSASSPVRGEIWKRVSHGKNPATLLWSGDPIVALTQDASTLYFVTEKAPADVSIRAIPKAGGEAREVFAGDKRFVEISAAEDADVLVLRQAGNDELLTMRKRPGPSPSPADLHPTAIHLWPRDAFGVFKTDGRYVYVLDVGAVRSYPIDDIRPETRRTHFDPWREVDLRIGPTFGASTVNDFGFVVPGKRMLALASNRSLSILSLESNDKNLSWKSISGVPLPTPREPMTDANTHCYTFLFGGTVQCTQTGDGWAFEVAGRGEGSRYANVQHVGDRVFWLEKFDATPRVRLRTRAVRPW